MDSATSTRAAENRTKWIGIFAKSKVVCLDGLKKDKVGLIESVSEGFPSYS